ncbi:MAG: signal peptide peptidase SppA [Gammaproteobacteria bacterium]|jgi:protease-4|nr:signal peptide peptidase SppA [Gammaproteobacteria bacterium]
MKKRNLLVRLLSGIWSGIDSFRKLLHLLLLLLLFAIFVGALSGTTSMLPDRAALLIQPVGVIVEELEGDPFDRAVAELLDESQPQTVLQDIIDALDYASTDERIAAVHIELSSLGAAGLPKLQRIARAIEDFRDSGKPVIASADFMTQQAYFIAAHADEVYLNPEGGVLLQGYGRFRSYFRDAIEKLKLDWNIFKVGTYKSAVEPFERMDMSDADREASLNLIEQLWGTYLEDVAAARGISVAEMEEYTSRFTDVVAAADGDLAQAARDHNLVDELLTRTELRELLIGYVGTEEDSDVNYSAIGMMDYLAHEDLLNGELVAEENIGIIIASGTIQSGSQPPGAIGADSTAALLRRARDDESVKAVVLRVDSPGGSAFASDVIANEIAALQDAGKPVVASMSSVAASGGYWISVGADRIFANPMTITGSIGIFGMIPTYQRTAAYLGIANDGIGSTPLAGQLRPDRAMTDDAKRLVQLVIEEGYDDFISRVATYRGMEKDDVDVVGQGRVWTGADALRHGLVDELGGLEEAIAFAAELVDIPEGEYGRKSIKTELSPTEQMIVDMLGTAKSFGLQFNFLRPEPSSLQRLAGRLEQALAPLAEFDDPKGVYAHCLCALE